MNTYYVSGSVPGVREVHVYELWLLWKPSDRYTMVSRSFMLL